MNSGYVELCIHFGFVAMFSLACPVVPILSILSCWALLSDKKLELYQAQRPTPSAKSTIGAWLTFCEVGIYIRTFYYTILTYTILIIITTNITMPIHVLYYTISLTYLYSNCLTYHIVSCTYTILYHSHVCTLYSSILCTYRFCLFYP